MHVQLANYFPSCLFFLFSCPLSLQNPYSRASTSNGPFSTLGPTRCNSCQTKKQTHASNHLKQIVLLTSLPLALPSLLVQSHNAHHYTSINFPGQFSRVLFLFIMYIIYHLNTQFVHFKHNQIKILIQYRHCSGQTFCTNALVRHFRGEYLRT